MKLKENGDDENYPDRYVGIWRGAGEYVHNEKKRKVISKKGKGKVFLLS